jgi:hypothetical protein
MLPGGSALSSLRRSAVTARRVRKISAKTATLVLAVAVIWLIVIAIMTLV